MSESALTRLWNSIKPPSIENRPPLSPEERELRRRQRKLVLGTLAGLAALGAGAYGWNYIASAPQRAANEYNEGLKLMSPGKYGGAVACFTRALNIKPQNPDAYLQRGDAHRALNELDAALADYQAAAQLNASLAPAHTGIAMIYLSRGDQRHALDELTRSIDLQPTTDAYYQRGQIYESQGDHRKAIAEYDRAIAEQRDAPFVYLARALAKQHLGDEQGAAEDRQAAAQITQHF